VKPFTAFVAAQQYGPPISRRQDTDAGRFHRSGRQPACATGNHLSRCCRHGASIARVLSAAVRLSSDVQHLSPRQQRDLALDCLHRSDDE
jgi:hypothetical protein